MPSDPYAVLRALLRAEAVRNAPKQPNPQPQPQPQPQPDERHKTPREQHGRD